MPRMARKQPTNRPKFGENFPPSVPDGTRVYAIGDIHGRADLLNRLLRKIGTDAVRAGADRNVLVCLGDYVDRGPNSKGVIDYMTSDPMKGFEVHCLLGNHEEIMLEFLRDPGFGENWILNGGDKALESYGITAPDTHSDDFNMADFKRLAAELREAMPKEHLDFLNSLILSHVEGDYLFVHAGIRPGVALDDQDPLDLIWIRETFTNDSRRYEKIVVHGHTITTTPDIHDNRIGIDTGAFHSGCLTALVLEGDQRTFITT